jgi:endonuclease III
MESDSLEVISYTDSMPRKARKSHSASEFDLDVLSGDTDLFRWFLLCYLFGKPIQSGVAVSTWQLFIEKKLDNPWAIAKASDRKLVSVLHDGGYTRYQHVTAHGLHVCMEKLIREYEGSLHLMLDSSQNEDEFSKRLQKLYGVGPKIAEIFMVETEEVFARRVE